MACLIKFLLREKELFNEHKLIQYEEYNGDKNRMGKANGV